MAEMQFLALLRGINVGGNTIIKMADLRSCFENMGYNDVITYIQSGNVIFRSEETDTRQLTSDIENGLAERFKLELRVVVIPQAQLMKVVESAPQGFGREPDKYRYDVIFLKEPLSIKEAMSKITPRPGIDNVWEGNNVIYFSRLISKAGQSYLTKVISQPVYKNMTIRNWNTTTRLFEIMRIS